MTFAIINAYVRKTQRNTNKHVREWDITTTCFKLKELIESKEL